MFEEFYKFRENPFQLIPNPDFLYKSENHQKALTYLEYGLMENVGIIVLTGEVGSGKNNHRSIYLEKSRGRIRHGDDHQHEYHPPSDAADDSKRV
jgi:general secretion pathway protein A